MPKRFKHLIERSLLFIGLIHQFSVLIFKSNKEHIYLIDDHFLRSLDLVKCLIIRLGVHHVVFQFIENLLDFLDASEEFPLAVEFDIFYAIDFSRGFCGFMELIVQVNAIRAKGLETLREHTKIG